MTECPMPTPVSLPERVPTRSDFEAVEDKIARMERILHTTAALFERSDKDDFVLKVPRKTAELIQGQIKELCAKDIT